MSVLSILAAAALLAASPESAQTRLAAGQAAFAKGELDKAIQQLDAAAKDAAQEGNEPLVAEIHLLRGQCFAGLGDNAKASEAFLHALEANPEAKLDPSAVRPSIVALLDKQRAEAKGELKVTSDLAADVYLDDQKAGPVPLAVPVGIGKHTLELRAADGRATPKQEIVVKANQPLSLNVPFGGAALPPPTVSAPADGRFGGLDVFADVRGAIEPAPPKGGLAMVGEVGAGVGVKYVAGSLHVGYGGKSFAAALRVTGRYPELFSIVGIHASLDVPLLIVDGSAVPALGGAIGLDVKPVSWIEPFLEAQYRHFFSLPSATYSADAVLVGLGARLRLP